MGLYLEEACKLKWWKGGTERKNHKLMAKHLISQRGSTLVCTAPFEAHSAVYALS